MSFRKVTNYATSACVRSHTTRRNVLQSAAVFSVNESRRTCPRPIHMSSALNQSSWGLRVEGIQGPLSALPSLKESRKILEAAIRDANAGFSQQGVQGSLHTGQSGADREDGGSMGGDRDKRRGASSVGDLGFEDTACPQGVQGDVENCEYFKTWLINCRRYGLQDCDEQLQGIQSGRLTLAQVMAEQEALIAEIAESYRKRARQQQPQVPEDIMQGTQGHTEAEGGGVGGPWRMEGQGGEFAEVPSTQGVQGDDCVRFRLWLETCHRFNLHECAEQLQGLKSGRTTLQEIFEEQDAMIREVVERYRKKHN